MEPITLPQPPTKLEFLEYLNQEYWALEAYYCGYFYGYNNGCDEKVTLLAEYNFDPTLADLETASNLLEWFEDFQSEELRKRVSLTSFEKHFNGDWRSGQEFQKVVITQRLYQTSPNSTQE